MQGKTVVREHRGKVQEAKVLEVLKNGWLLLEMENKQKMKSKPDGWKEK